jgi:hypothetical protein
MYGYVRPLKGELKVSQYESFRAVYCGLCHELKRRYGPAARFLVNYDFTFLAMLLYGGQEPGCEMRCCPVSWRRKHRCLCSCPELGVAADYTVILAWWKLRDGAHDERLFKGLGFRLASVILHGAYRKAKKAQSEFADTAEQRLLELDVLEADRCPSIDRMAEKFALILQSVADGVSDVGRRRVLDELLYHIGRIVYILDAVDDLAEDYNQRRYNPLVYRFSAQSGVLSDADRDSLRLTLRHSYNSVSSAFALLPKNPWTDILANTLYLGLPWVAEMVFSGRWKEQKEISIHH